MRNRPIARWIAAGISLSLLLPIVGSIVSAAFFADLRIEHVPVHSLVEAAGGLMAIAIASILIVERSRKNHAGHFTWMATALMGMGVLDLYHAAVYPGNHFVWFHSIATFVGGVIFACVWFPERLVREGVFRWLPWSMLAVTVIYGGIACLSNSLPRMTSVTNEFTLLARGLNVIGGLGFFVAGLFFVLRFHRHAEETDWLFAVHTVLFGAAGVLFEFSALWDAAWWWWHVLRLIAYGAAFVFAVSTYVDVERAVFVANERLTRLNQKLDQRIEERTSRLREVKNAMNWLFADRLTVCGIGT